MSVGDGGGALAATAGATAYIMRLLPETRTLSFPIVPLDIHACLTRLWHATSQQQPRSGTEPRAGEESKRFWNC